MYMFTLFISKSAALPSAVPFLQSLCINVADYSYYATTVIFGVLSQLPKLCAGAPKVTNIMSLRIMPEKSVSSRKTNIQ